MSYIILTLLRDVYRYRHKEFEYFYIPKIIYENRFTDCLYGMHVVFNVTDCEKHHIYFRKQKI